MHSIALLAVLAQTMTDVQIIGSHNSYHAGLAPSEMAYLLKVNPKAAKALDYSHPPLLEQLKLGVRKFELDIFSDSRGGLFAEPSLPSAVAKYGLPADPPFDPKGKMKKPGYKIVHVQDIDYRSSCQPLTDCLTTIRDWSIQHPHHLPIYILLETKTSGSRKTSTTPEPITTESLNALDQEILSVFEKTHLITPDLVRGKFKTLEEAVLTKGWPLMKQSRGKIVFLFDQENITPLYTKDHPSLEGRIVFTNSKAGNTDAAFMKINNPNSELIAEMVKKGYLVRTRADDENGYKQRSRSCERRSNYQH